MVPTFQDKSKQLSSEVRFPVRNEAQTGRGAAVGSPYGYPHVLSHFEVLLALSSCA